MIGVAKAGRYARRLVDRERFATGQPIKRVIGAVAARLKQPRGSIFGLLFRKPKTVSVELMEALEAAVEKEVRREIASLENELRALSLGIVRRNSDDLEEIAADLGKLRARLTAFREGGSDD